MAPSRINPTLFDKLVADLEIEGMKDEGANADEAGRSAMRYYSVSKIERFNEAALRATVLRELNWILNTTNLGSAQDLSAFPEVQTSVLNYGVPDMAGKLMDKQAVSARSREIRTGIRRFEPRIEPQKLDVEASTTAEKPNAVTFIIRGDVTAAVNALPVEFKTDVEIDSGAATLRD
jgi:type VI secretion system protein ImpF